MSIGDLFIYISKLQSRTGKESRAGHYGRWIAPLAALQIDGEGIRSFRDSWPTFGGKGAQGNAYLRCLLWKIGKGGLLSIKRYLISITAARLSI